MEIVEQLDILHGDDDMNTTAAVLIAVAMDVLTKASIFTKENE